MGQSLVSHERKTSLAVSSVDETGQSITSQRESMNSSQRKLEKEVASQARKLLKKWIPIFALKDWHIQITTVPGGVISTPNGPSCMSNNVHKGSKVAQIAIDFEYEWNDKDGHNGFEFTLLHELLHIIAIEQGVDIFKDYLNKQGAHMYWEYEEEMIDRVAKILLSAQD